MDKEEEGRWSLPLPDVLGTHFPAVGAGSPRRVPVTTLALLIGGPLALLGCICCLDGHLLFRIESRSQPAGANAVAPRLAKGPPPPAVQRELAAGFGHREASRHRDPVEQTVHCNRGACQREQCTYDPECPDKVGCNAGHVTMCRFCGWAFFEACGERRSTAARTSTTARTPPSATPSTTPRSASSSRASESIGATSTRTYMWESDGDDHRRSKTDAAPQNSSHSNKVVAAAPAPPSMDYSHISPGARARIEYTRL